MIWTPTALAERLGGDMILARELVEIFLAEYCNLLQTVRGSVQRNDAQAIRRSAHALRGSIANFIDDGPVTTAAALERAGEEARSADVALLLTQLEREVEELATAMRCFAGDD